nr:hypothetical protein [Tanacetum cinerariifolium]
TLQQQVSGEEKLKAAFEEFKRQQDDRVEQRCAEIDARMDVLSIDFDEEFYPHMLTAIAGRRWVIGCGLRLAVMKCGESLEPRQAFADFVSAGISKGLSEGLRHGLEHGQAQLNLESIEAYDPKAEAKFVAALQALKDLKYPLVDQLEGLKDASMDVIMAALYLESDTGDDAPHDVCDLRPSSSQLTIPVYLEVRDPRNPWACKEEMVLADAIGANISRAEKKKKCRIVCRTHGVGSAHHARSNGVPVSVPTVVPQAIAGRRWVIGRGLRLAIMKCDESLELRQVFVDVVSAGIAKGMSEGLRHGVEYGKAQLSIESIEAYDPKAEAEYVAALQALKDLKYPLVDQLEVFKNAPMEACKEEMLLADAIAANISRAEKKKKCRIVCRNHGVGSAHHAWSDDISVFMPTVVPQGLALLLADAATQTEFEEDT